MKGDKRLRFLTFLLLSAAAVAGAAVGSAPDYAQLRQARAQQLLQPDGWFSLVALEHLQNGDTSVGSAPGASVVLAHVPARLLTLHKAGDTVTLAAANPALLLAGKPVHAGEALSTQADTQSEDTAHALRSGDVLLWVIRRGTEQYLRVKDAQAPERVHFHGLNWYAPQARYRVEAKWVPYPAGHTLAITNKLGQLSHQAVPGYAEFSFGGRKATLTPTVDDGRLFFVFRDETGSLETDGGGRFLTVDAPGTGLGQPGTLMLDFNQAVNPPCAYSPYATCPLAPRENRLSFTIPAGEKRYDTDAP